MNGQKDFFKRLVDALNNAGIPYMLSGSMGSGFHGQPRATNDVDIVIAPTEAQLCSFLQSLGKDYYVSLDAAREALKRESAFNVIDMQGGWKADFIIRRQRPFSIEEFQRRQKVSIMGLGTWIVSPEDIILIKLEWAKNSKSDRQLEDALRVAMVQVDRLDEDYLHKWAKELNVESSLKQLLEQVKKQMKSG
jgi:hypothetical protein